MRMSGVRRLPPPSPIAALASVTLVLGAVYWLLKDQDQSKSE
jgi:hypothetical protein